MLQRKYKIYRLSARAVVGHAKLHSDGRYSFALDATCTDKCKIAGASEQEDNALFFQIMAQLHGNDFTFPKENTVITDLTDILFVMDFDGIFDKTKLRPRDVERQNKVQSMFCDDGITLDFGTGPHRYLPFERSGSMSRAARLSFIREDYYTAVRQRIMMDLSIGMCQLSKLYAYNGLMMSGGYRVTGIEIDKPHRVIVIDNPTFQIPRFRAITMEPDGWNGDFQKYRRVEKYMDDLTITAFDGEGLISKEYSAVVDKALCGKHIHTSFQIRMPYVKGMLHQVDFKDFFASAGTSTITDIWGVKHKVGDVDIILTRSMFKGFGWLKDSGKSWADYWAAFRKYNHALYITNFSKEDAEDTTELNYQFLNTISMQAEEFRPADLPDGWISSPAEDPRHWLTKETEQRYYDLCANEAYRLNYFKKHAKGKWFKEKDRDYWLGRILQKNPLFISEPVYTERLNSAAEGVVKRYGQGKLVIRGDNRFLSGDLLYLLTWMLDDRSRKKSNQRTFYSVAISNHFPQDAFYAPGAKYKAGEICTILRNPHIARNEEILLKPYTEENIMRQRYLGQLTDVIMIDSHILAAERLGGADYDGDMVKTIADPVLIQCVMRNYEFESISNSDNIPLLVIPTAEPQIRDANDWKARYETVKNTFSSRVGHISNAALDRGIIAYDENSAAEQRQRYREEVEMLAILTGLEIDSGKSGIKPDLSAYLDSASIKRSPFLKYKQLIEEDEKRGEWYEPTHRERVEKYFSSIDWSQVSSNVERLPYLAYLLRKNTPKIKAKKNDPALLYGFATKPGWKNDLDSTILAAVTALADDYDHCLRRIRASRKMISDRAKETDIRNILFSRGQEDMYDTDVLYALFSTLSQERVAEIRSAITEQTWHLLSEAERGAFLSTYLPEAEFAEYYDLLSDFRHSGYRILGDLICDCDDSYRQTAQQKLHTQQDSPAMTAMLNAFLSRDAGKDYTEIVAEECKKQIGKIIKPSDAVQYVVAAGKDIFLWDVLYAEIYSQVKKAQVEKHAK